MNNNQQSTVNVTENTSSPQCLRKSIYKKPKTSLFLDPSDIQGGDVNVPESNNGFLS